MVVKWTYSLHSIISTVWKNIPQFSVISTVESHMKNQKYCEKIGSTFGAVHTS